MAKQKMAKQRMVGNKTAPQIHIHNIIKNQINKTTHTKTQKFKIWVEIVKSE
jgi:hypothetical protein